MRTNCTVLKHKQWQMPSAGNTTDMRVRSVAQHTSIPDRTFFTVLIEKKREVTPSDADLAISEGD
jgi:hypothetical protein